MNYARNELNEKKQAMWQWIHQPSEANEDQLSNIRSDCFCQPSNIQSVSGVRLIEIHRAVPETPDPNYFKFQITTKILKTINFQVVMKLL
jgi:hypothetical protein